MDSVIIVTDHSVDLNELQGEIPIIYTVDKAANERILIEREGRRAYLGADPRIGADMEPEEASRILGMIPHPTFYVLDFNDIGLCKEILFSIADRSDVLIDNDHGVLLSGSEFVRMLRARQDWDWRREPPL